ncbi:MAG: PAS domain-containing sensor histidine kinase [Hymenobacter sp.]|nr:MAG: PAS domain-containing sensor histidine kinase [Hymenobacter sp.]
MSELTILPAPFSPFAQNNPAADDFLQNILLDGLWYWNLLAPTEAWVNDKYWQTLGYGPHELPTAPEAWRAPLHPDDLAETQQAAEACLRAPDQPFNQLLRATHRNGATVWLHCRGIVLRNDAGTAAWLLGALFDVSHEKQAQAQAEELAEHYRQILSNQSVYIVKTDTEGNYTFANEYFYERYGYAEDIISTSSLLSIVEEDRAKCIEVVLQCFAQPEVRHQVILRKLAFDNTVKSNHWELKGLLDENGRLVEILCVGYDVTLLVENLQKQQHLLDVTSQQNMRLQNFAYIISHNIRSHSANLTSLVQLLAEAKSKAQKSMFLQMLTTSTEQLADTIVNLNDIVTIHSNVNKPKTVRALRTEIDKTLEVLSVLVRQHHIAVEVDVPPTLEVTVVPAYLDSILLNLLSNAVKYRSPNRPAFIRLRARPEPGGVVLTVQDNGRGIDLVKNQAKLFGMYKTFHDNEDARGVGLFITKNQVEAMLGTISVDSQVEVGTTFTIHFNENA